MGITDNTILINDVLTCEYPLPLPEGEEEFFSKDYDWDDHEWILKKVDIVQPTLEYQIGSNGYLYKKNRASKRKG